MSTEVLRVQVFGADPGHAEREARELRDELRGLGGVEARLAASPSGPSAAGEGAKGQPLLTPEVVLIITGGSFAVVRAAIRGWVDVRKSRRARIEYPDGGSVELHGGMSARELRELQGRPESEQ
ncbi:MULTISPECIES: hypothetical protein [unclassified Streptomyces]|uniref:effector-associated constant component EACC1 n=1 Tax=unclassified Streptomyces TaxID=2593676 RepID=UPI0037F86DB2